jgi:outer membrane biosynthesis protein TonB
MTSENEKKNQRIGMAVSLGLHGLMLLLFFLIMAWREPDPPIPEYGIELNFGLQDAGAGEIQPEEPSSSVPEIEEEMTPEESSEEVTESIEETDAIEETDLPEEQAEEIIDSESLDSPDLIEPQEEEKKETDKVQEQVEKVEEQVKENVDSPVIPGEQNVGQLNNRDEATETQSQGDNANAEGDKGVEEGSIDSRSLYGSHGGGGGPTLDLTGWTWDTEPDPKDTSNENGKIVFEIKIDDRGEIISVRTIEKTVSPVVERIYREEVESLTFSPLSNNTVPAPVSTGRITFLIRSK